MICPHFLYPTPQPRPGTLAHRLLMIAIPLIPKSPTVDILIMGGVPLSIYNAVLVAHCIRGR
jgi:hypothetical protein